MNREKTVIVTGGGGFLGKKICSQLKEKGYHVVSLSRHKYPDLEKMGVESRVCDLRNKEDVLWAVRDSDSLIHTAAKAGYWGKAKDFYETNFVGTQNLLDASLKNGVKHFVYTSSPSVCFDGSDILGANEDTPYAKKHLCSYSESKHLAEKLVLDTAKSTGLRAAALRPHLIWGPDDPHFLPRLKQRASQGKLFKLGSGKNLVDVIYVDNAAKAHLKLLETLFKSDLPRGQAYFIGQEKPVLLWSFVDQLLEAYSIRPLRKRVPLSVAYPLSILAETVFKGFNIYKREPQLTRFLALQLAKSHYFSHSKAEKDFDYRPEISTEEGLRLLKASAARKNRA